MNEPADLRASLQTAILEIEALQAQLDAYEEPVAIVGVGCRLPGAEGPEQAWARLRAREVACAEPPETREAIAAAFDPDPEAPGRACCARAAYLDGIETFDAGFFRMLPPQAAALDPQQRLLLETSWGAIEDAGIDPGALKGSRTGVYVGLSFDDYGARPAADGARLDPVSTLGAARSLAAGRISYFLDLKGPAVQLDTACSSAAVALHQAVRGLRSGDCELALAGGANAILAADTMVRLSQLKALSPNGRCRSFEAAADGYGRGEGAVMFLLSRLSSARTRGQRIRAVIRGSAVNHDGASNGLTAPNGRAQEAVVRAALADARANPDEIAFIEAHGTGTPLGDPIEAAALAAVFAGRRTGDVLLGSSKAQFGHLEAAAGALGVLRAALCLEHGLLPGQPGGTTPTPRIDWTASPLRLALADAPLPPTRPLAGVSSFGMSGTNAHLVLERPPEDPRRSGADTGLAMLSAATAPALRARAGTLAAWIRARPDVCGADLERSLLARAGLAHRAVFDLADPQALAEHLQAFSQGDAAAALACGVASRLEASAPIDGWDDRAAVIAAFVAGAPIDPQLAERHPGRPLSLPPYPFERTRHWIDEAPSAPAGDRRRADEPSADAMAGEDVRQSLRALLSSMLGVPAAGIDERTPFVEIGADSLILLDAVRAIEQRFGVSIPMGQLFAGLSTIEALAAYVADRSRRGIDPTPARPVLAGEGEAPTLSPQPDRQDPTARSSYFEGLIEAYGRRHAGSKGRASASRTALADSRRAVGFRPSFKEALFPIVGARGEGPCFWDVDGNQFVDTAMGFGVYLFGHGHAPVETAIEAARRSGLPIGPQSPDAGEVAEALCRLTGFERAAFCNTGTEAVMTALRLARAATRRNGVALFKGAYHGHFDGVLGASAGGVDAVPATPGVTPGFVSDLMVLDYGADAALEEIDRHGQALAAVLVEPVQSRNPALQPAAFLQRLRQLADRHGYALIFDEVLTGLRVHPAGAHGLLGVKPDLATYGKVLGGGLPVGAVAGGRRFLDGIDGGAWSYGDASAPTADRVFFGGTFNKNAISMAAAKAVLEELTRAGPGLQEELNARTSAMVRRLQDAIGGEQLPVTVQHFGSLFRFGFAGNADAFYLELAMRGVYVWEGRNCFLSTAHEEADVDHIVAAVLGSLRAMREGGLLETQERPHPTRPPRAPPEPVELPDPRAIAAELTAAGLPAVGREHAERTRQLDAAAMGFAARALKGLTAGESLDPARLRVSEAGRRLIACLIDWLVQEGLLEPADGVWRWRAAAAPDVAAALASARALGGEAEARLLERAGSALGDVLSRTRHALDALAPGGDFGALSEIYVRPALAKAVNRLLAEACARIAAALPGGRPLDVLEIGAGTGGATGVLTAALGDRPFRYLATDVSAGFFTPDHWLHAPDPRLSFGRYDMDRPADTQGLAAAGFDLILASNALHVARDLDFTLAQLQRLLRPGGVLVLAELTAAPRWLQLTFGITDGWWRRRDRRDRREAADAPLLAAPSWEAALAAAGLPVAASVAPEAEPGAAVVIAQKRGSAEPSRAQQELLALASADEDGGSAYNLCLVAELHGSVDGGRLARAIAEEARGHEALSAVFLGEPARMVFGAARIADPARVDLSAEPDPAAAAQAWCSGFGDSVFDLSTGPLFRAAVLELGAGRLQVALAAPHIVADAMSLALIWDGAVRRYGGAAGAAGPSFAAHLEAERLWLETAEAAGARGFWRERLPAPGPRSASGWAGGVVEAWLGPEVVGAVRRRAARAGLTPYMLCFAAFALVMRADPRAAVIGVPVSGRRRAPEGLVGYCTHLLPIAVAPPAGATVGDWLGAVREVLVEAYAHQDLPFAEMRRGSAAQVDVTFNLDSGALSAPDGARARLVGWRSRREPFPLRVNLTAVGDEVVIEAGHQSGSYAPDDVAVLIGRFAELLERLADTPDEVLLADLAPAPAAAPLRAELALTPAPPGPSGPCGMSELEQRLAEAIARALNLDAVGPDDDFFELGGDSIVSLQAAAAARRAGYVLDTRVILRERTVRAIARQATGAQAAPVAAGDRAAAAAQNVLAKDDYAALVSVFED